MSVSDNATLERIVSGDGMMRDDRTLARELAAEVIALRARAERAEVAYSTLLRAAREHLAAVDAVGSAVDPRGEPTRGDLALAVAFEAEHSAAARLRTLLGEG